jgi:hypothetical protein
VQAPPVAEPRFSLTSDDDAIAHLVCCREASWEVAFCGEPNDVIAMNATAVCTMCIEVAKSRRPEWDMYADPPECPQDGEPCPDEHDIDLRILREVTP